MAIFFKNHIRPGSTTNRIGRIAFVFALALSTTLPAEESVEFDTGRTRPAKGGVPVLGSGLAMSKGPYRGVSMGELSGWTVTLWFEARSGELGNLLGIVRNANRGEAIRLSWEAGKLTFGELDRKNNSWKLEVDGVAPEKWHQVAVSYEHETGPVLYLDGKEVARGKRGQMGYSTKFDNYHFGAALLGKGKYGSVFDGLIDDFTLHSRPLSAEEMERLYRGEKIDDALIAFDDFENVNHRDLARFSESDRDEAYLSEGQKLYELHCVACHSKDGISPPPNPLSRMFTKHKMENGGDPYSMFQTLTYGFRNMMPAVQLNPQDRYKVIHYLREKVIKEKAPTLSVDLADSYTDPMPQGPRGSGEAAARLEALAKTGYLRDYGRALVTPITGDAKSLNALAIDLGNETTIAYDLGSMRSVGAWTGGFLDFSNTLHHKLRAPGLPTANFEMIPGSNGWRWAWNGKAENQMPNLRPRTTYPEDQIRYRGHYPFGDEIIVSFTVQERGVFESPLAESTSDDAQVIHHRFTVEPSENALELIVFGIEGAKPEIKDRRATVEWKGRQYSAAIQGEPKSLNWRVSAQGELVLQIPPSESPLQFNLSIGFQRIEDRPFDSELSTATIDLAERIKQGGPSRWSTSHTLKGKLNTSTFQGYAMDSLPVPLKNAYNSWMRTSSLAFFPDGRLAVGTLAGDVWIVSGIDDNLEEVTWKRFAAGLYEPLGMKVVDGILTATTRGRIVKLHDNNGDGEADFYEAFFNEDEPSDSWHAYSFDLEVDKNGFYYYGRTGGMSNWSVPGGIVKVSPDGKSTEVIGAGLRVPNGLGLLPDGRVTFGDNQGKYVPAGKIAITSPGAFHGAGKWTNKGNYDPASIVDPVVYLPQDLDSSCGAQLWVGKDERFGPLGGQYFHTSYGKAATMYVMLDDLGDTVQGAVFSLPLKMESGTMRVAKNPVDGQLYFSGLTGWQSGATREGSIQRLRYTGGKGLYLSDAKARSGRLELSFTDPVEVSESDSTKWNATAWNYRWSDQYGSPHFKVTEPGVEGTDQFEITRIEPSSDGRKLTVHIPELQPCHTLKLDFSVEGGDETALTGSVYFTIYELP